MAILKTIIEGYHLQKNSYENPIFTKPFLFLREQEDYVQMYDVGTNFTNLHVRVVNENGVIVTPTGIIAYEIILSKVVVRLRFENAVEGCLRLLISYHTAPTVLEVWSSETFRVLPINHSDLKQTIYIQYRHTENHYDTCYAEIDNLYQSMRIPMWFTSIGTEGEAEVYDPLNGTNVNRRISRVNRSFIRNYTLRTNDFILDEIAIAFDSDIVYIDGVRHNVAPINQGQVSVGEGWEDIDVQTYIRNTEVIVTDPPLYIPFNRLFISDVDSRLGGVTQNTAVDIDSFDLTYHFSQKILPYTGAGQGFIIITNVDNTFLTYTINIADVTFGENTVFLPVFSLFNLPIGLYKIEFQELFVIDVYDNTVMEDRYKVMYYNYDRTGDFTYSSHELYGFPTNPNIGVRIKMNKPFALNPLFSGVAVIYNYVLNSNNIPYSSVIVTPYPTPSVISTSTNATTGETVLFLSFIGFAFRDDSILVNITIKEGVLESVLGELNQDININLILD